MATQQNHYRSISFPSRSSKSTNFQAHIQNLKSLETNLTSEAIQAAVLNLAELHNFVQESLAQSQNSQNTNSSIEESLSASVDFLDVCSSIRDLAQMIGENVRSLQSTIRRKGLDFSHIENEMNSYSCFRKRANKFAAKTVKSLKNMESKNRSSLSSPVDENGGFAGVLSDLGGLTIAILKSTLFFLSCSEAGKSGGWKLISRSHSRNNCRFISELESARLPHDRKLPHAQQDSRPREKHGDLASAACSIRVFADLPASSRVP
ncbi:Arabidopsis protein of unknown function (DUF241 [Striga hermonthica]|uniref:Uncharacterized protein n=1 Tax=Striga hermonthica TaxID=68872 RepID=A0A9N7NHX1_STRHE|nr:Arabidopsis protein of unknown function (DUF241 [Striga hermonthica]